MNSYNSYSDKIQTIKSNIEEIRRDINSIRFVCFFLFIILEQRYNSE